MQVSVEKLDGLERRMTVQVPAEQIDPEVLDRLKSLTPKVKMRGFRPGKVPFKMVKRMYGAQVRQEVMSEVLQRSYAEAIAQENLRPVSNPSIEPKQFAEGENFEYSATFEVLPEFELKDIENLQIERPVVEITETDVDGMIEDLRKQRVSWVEVTRPAQRGDRISFDYEAQSEDQDSVGDRGENTQIVLGEDNTPKEIEDALIGLQSGTETELDITFPENHYPEDRAGKQVHFKISVKAVAEPELPEVDDAFAESFDIKENGVDGLRQSVRNNMERQLHHAVRANLRHQVTQELLKANDIPLPRIMVEQEIDRLATKANLNPPGDGADETFLAAKVQLFGHTARQRVAINLIMARLIEANELRLEEARVQHQLDEIAADYQDGTAVRQWYEQNPQALESIRALALDEQVIDWILERVKIVDRVATFDDIVKPRQNPQSESLPEQINHD